MTLRLAVLISGAGSNLQAICRAIDTGTCDATVVAVISDRDNAAGLGFARERGIATMVIAPKAFADRATWNEALAIEVARHTPDVVVLAGFMKIVGTPLLQRFPQRIINVHPALLPAFPGIDAPAQAIAARVRISGCTVHLVDGGVDTGPILAQAAVAVCTSDDAHSLHQRIQVYEHQLLPQVIHAVARGEIVLGAQPEARLSVDTQAALISPHFAHG